jgi:predicted acylesterase/phospholipase RssA
VRIPCPKAITYLALEGGGGKGVTYLGAMKALRELKVLPIRHGCENQLKGISGASAGAITALMLTLGFSDDDQQPTSLRGFLRVPSETWGESAGGPQQPCRHTHSWA